MRSDRSEKGFVFFSLVGMLVLTFVAMTLLTMTLSRSDFLARQSHLLMLRRQAEWLAEGAVERGLAALFSAADPSKVGKQTFTISLAPVFIGSDPLSENDGDESIWDRSFTVSYGFSVSPADNFPKLRELSNGAKLSFLLVGRAEVPHRQTTLTRSAARLCFLDKDGSWTVMPIADLAGKETACTTGSI